MSCGVGHRHGADPTLLWLWCRLAAVAPIRPLAWELPYATGEALKEKKKKEKTHIHTHSLIYGQKGMIVPLLGVMTMKKKLPNPYLRLQVSGSACKEFGSCYSVLTTTE